MSLFWVFIHKSFDLCLPQKFTCCLAAEKYFLFLQLSVMSWKNGVQYFSCWYLVFWGVYNRNTVKNFELFVLGSKNETAFFFPLRLFHMLHYAQENTLNSENLCFSNAMICPVEWDFKWTTLKLFKNLFKILGMVWKNIYTN